MQQRDRHRMEDLEDIVKADAATIEALRAENARLRKALKPFSDAAKHIPENSPDNSECWPDYYEIANGWMPTVGDLRAARAAMGETDAPVSAPDRS